MNNQIDHDVEFFKPGISPTSINQFYESPSRFWKYSSYNPDKERKEATDAMKFGRLVHCLTLTPEAFEKDFAVVPVKGEGDLDTIDDIKKLFDANNITYKKSGSKAEFVQAARQLFPQAVIWSDVLWKFNQTVGRKTIVTKEQVDQARSMQEAMWRNKAVRQLIGNGFSERPYTWYTEEDGLMWKCKLDYVRAGLVIEYKTCDDPCSEQFAKTIANMGYHRQIAFQMSAAARINGEAAKGGLIIAQDKEMHDDIAIYALNSVDLAIGAEENLSAYHQIKRRMKEKDWRSFPESIQPIEMPRWYKPKS